MTRGTPKKDVPAWKKEKRRKAIKTITITPEVYQEAFDMAYKKGRTFSNIVEELLREKLKAYKKEQGK